MAAPPKDVKIANTKLTHVLEVRLSVSRAVDGLNQPQGATKPPCVVIVRDASQGAELVGFANVSNDDGKDALITAEFTIPKNRRTPAYVVKVIKGHIANWFLTTSGDDEEPDREVIEIYAGEISVSAGGGNEKLKLKGYRIS